ncbi:hypothetical protein G6F56_003869 [Rhizopus delemar]|nr:hypothetical protein G6F56_003869 [Rhizopus delemar]
MTSQHESRDPIMEDDHFSLRFDNPIQIIHDSPKHAVDPFEPSKGHSPLLPQLQEERPSLQKKKSSHIVRDTACNDYFHNKNGTIDEIDHTKDE